MIYEIPILRFTFTRRPSHRFQFMLFLEFATAELGEALAETRTDFVRRVRIKVVPSLLRGERHALVYPVTPTGL